MPMEVKPVGFRVLVEQLENRQYGQIALPENTQQHAFYRFKVVAVGDAGVLMDGSKAPIPCAVGDEIMFNAQRAIPCGPPEFFGGRKLAIVEADGIMAVFGGEPDLPRQKIIRANSIPGRIAN